MTEEAGSGRDSLTGTGSSFGLATEAGLDYSDYLTDSGLGSASSG